MTIDDLLQIEINDSSSETILKSSILKNEILENSLQQKLLEIIRKSLLSTNSKTLKYSIFLLQKILKKQNLIEKFTQTENHWNNFFLMFETLQEQQLHLVLPQLEIFKSKDLFDDFWLEILISKAIQNENLKTRFKIIEFLLEFHIPTKIIAVNQSFLITVLQVCTRQTYYQDLLKGSFKSDFGELVAGYISSLSAVLTTDSYENLMVLVADFIPKIQSRIPSIFILEGFTALAAKMNLKIYGKREFMEIIFMLSSKLGKSIFKTTKTRALMAILLIKFLQFTFNGEDLSTAEIIKVLGSLISSNDIYDEIASVDGALELIKSLLFQTIVINIENLKKEVEAFIASDSIIYGDYEKQFCAGLAALINFKFNTKDFTKTFITEFSEKSNPRLYMILLSLIQLRNFSISSELQRDIVKVCTEKLRAVNAFDQADLVCRLLAVVVKKEEKYPELELLTSDNTTTQNRNLRLYVSIKLLNILYQNKSIISSSDLAERHSKYLNYTITVQSNYDAVAVQIFNKSKYQLLVHLLNCGSGHSNYLNYCVDQLGICSFDNLDYVFDSLEVVIEKVNFTEYELDLVSTAIKLVMSRFEEAWKSSNSWFKLVLKFIDFLYCRPILKNMPKKVIDTTKILLKWSETRMGIINPISKHLTSYWKSITVVDELKNWIPTMLDLCSYGPDRQSLDIEVRMESLILHKLSNVEITDERYETCLWDFNCQDYVVRVDVNHYFMGLKTSEFSWLLITSLLSRLESKLLKRKNYVNSFNQKLSMRLGMSLQILIKYCPKEKKSELLAELFKALAFEKVVESMAWLEWAIARLVLENLNDLQSQFFEFFKECNKVAHCAHSMVLVSLQLMPLISDPVLKSNFTVEAILLSLSWSGNKLYPIRVLTQYLIQKHYFSHPRLENLSYFLDHIKQNQDSQRAFEKIKLYHFFNDFNPLQVSAEFIFRGFLTMMEYSVEERISSLAFVKVCVDSGCNCGYDLGYASRKELSQLLKRSVRPRIVDTTHDADEETSNVTRSTENTKTNANIEQPHQRKIVSWQTFMSTDIELSGFRKLDTIKPRLNLQIIASLISKPVNLGGLTRTCETFSCGLLCMDTLDVVKDPSFLSTCVSAEKWCPMKEVKKDDILSYLLQVKSEGWSVIGIEQATTSVILSEFKFPLKSVLLLGKEKEGIPADLLLACDHIVEIPQSGMIKSLNVHVSGSLVLYEYFRQHGGNSS